MYKKIIIDNPGGHATGQTRGHRDFLTSEVWKLEDWVSWRAKLKLGFTRRSWRNIGKIGRN